jgi:cephalosporin-C deacetylase-like acetyl esterase
MSAAGLGAGWLETANSKSVLARALPRDAAIVPAENLQFSVSVREYLSSEARKITNSALADYSDPATFHRLVPERRRQYWEMMGFWDFPPRSPLPPLNVKVTGVVQRPRYRIEKLYYESLPKLYVDANLYVPNDLKGKAPAILYTCGHESNQKIVYQAHGRRFAEMGFVCLLIETIESGEVKGYHHGPWEEGWFHWYSRGYTPAGIEMLNGIRGIDLLVERPDVDAKNIGTTGISGGGTYSWWIPAGDERVKAAASHCGTSMLASYIYDRAVDRTCDCQYWINTYLWDQAEVGALIAPRPFLISASILDKDFNIAAVQEVYQQLARLYEMLGAAENLQFLPAPGPHGYGHLSRTTIFSWFAKHLQGKDLPPDQIPDLDESPEKQESEDTLRVFVKGAPADDRVPTIQDDFFVPPEPPQVASAEALKELHKQVLAQLRAKTFAALPKTPPPLDLRVEYEYQLNENVPVKGSQFTFTSEKGWRLRGYLLGLEKSAPQPAPAVVMLRSPEEFDRETYLTNQIFWRQLRVPWAKLIVEPRGTGDTAWGPELDWHVRRASTWIGRTVASMRVYDTLRGLEVIRQLPYVDGRRVALAARGEMAAVALYAALLDGQVSTLFLESPPATQNVPSDPEGHGPALEMLNCMRITDLPQVAGLLYPTELVFVGHVPANYGWTEELYARLGPPGKLWQLQDLTRWQPG